jgi:hypothetical protein
MYRDLFFKIPNRGYRYAGPDEDGMILAAEANVSSYRYIQKAGVSQESST